METIKRKLLYLKPAHSEAVLYPEISAAGWDVRIVEHQEEARRPIASKQFHVGLALFDQPSDWELLDSKIFNVRASMEWIALVAPQSMRLPTIARRIRSNFYDYQTLPVDSQRLLLALGHAYGMATLAGNHLPATWQSTKHRPVVSLQKARLAAEQAAIESALRKTDHNMTKAASELGISRVTLYRLLEKGRMASGSDRGSVE